MTMIGIGERLRANAVAFPDKSAIIHPRTCATGEVTYERTSYLTLSQKVDAYAAGFRRIGITHATKTILMLRPGPELFAVLIALFTVGAVPVIVDPGMGLARMLHCYRSAGAQAFIGIPAAHAIRVLHSRTFAGLRVRVTAGRRWWWGGYCLADTAELHPVPQGPPLSADDLLAITFTTGSTGPAKGVEYTHGMLAAMAQQVVTTYAHTPDDVSLVTLPLFGLFDLMIGATVVLAPIDPTKVASADPRSLVEAIQRFGVTTMFASPALLDRLGRHAADTGLRLPGMRCLVSGGAPVSDSIVASVHQMLGEPDHGRVFTSYGATEALPISTIDASEILASTRATTSAGGGTCVGRPVPGMAVRVIRITDEPVAQWSDELLVASTQIGEITIAGPTVSRRYHSPVNANANAQAKILDGDRVWHRTGDLGWIDHEDRIWFCGRKAELVLPEGGRLCTVACEGIFNAHPDVHRTALVGVGRPGNHVPVLCVEPRASVRRHQRPRLAHELRTLASAHQLTNGITTVLFPRRFPVDIRHNAKIGREELAAWATSRLTPRHTSRVLYALPVAGWAFLLYGTIHPVSDPVLVALFWIDALLSIVVHGIQLPVALPRARTAGYAAATGVLLTFLLGATWWRTLPVKEQP